jgi:trehalose 6-phosphate phosphatase
MEYRTPPPLDPERNALFLDFDGSLVDFALTPDRVVVLPETIALLAALRLRLGGALAIVTGRRIADIDHHLSPLRLPISGVHGLEFRPDDGDTTAASVSDELQVARRRLEVDIGPSDPIFVEDKGGALVLHFRASPDQRRRAASCARKAAEGLDSLHVMGGHSIFEIRQHDVTKADAVRRFMQRPPFAGRMPIFAGDDLTDEDGFRAAAALGGFGVKIGPGKTRAEFRLPGTQAVHTWLEPDKQGTEPPNAR